MKGIVQAALKDRIKDDTEKREKDLKEKIDAKRNEEKKTKEMIKNIE